MQLKTYIIEYEVYGNRSQLLKSGKIRCKNRSLEIEAKIKLEEYLKKSITGFQSLVIKKCIDEMFNFDSLNNVFGDIFGTKNPFGSK